MGFVHHGTVTNASIAYTLEYMSCASDLDRMHGNDDRLPEFSTFSKGLGQNYLTNEVKTFHKKNIMDMYITIEDGTKIPMPRFYRNKIFTDEEKSEQAFQIGPVVEQQYNDEFNKKGARQMEEERKARLMKIKKKSKKS